MHELMEMEDNEYSPKNLAAIGRGVKFVLAATVGLRDMPFADGGGRLLLLKEAAQ